MKPLLIMFFFLASLTTSAQDTNCRMEVKSFETYHANGDWLSSSFPNSTLTQEIHVSDLKECIHRATFLCRWQQFEGITKKGLEAKSRGFKKVKLSFIQADGSVLEEVLKKDTELCHLQ